VLCASLLTAQEAKESRQPETVRFREFPDIVQEIAKDVETSDRAIVVWLVDHTTATKTARILDTLGQQIPKAFKKPRISHAIVAMGEQPQLVQKPTDDLARFATSLSQLANANPDNSVKSCLGNIREAAKVSLSVSSVAKKYVVLLTQENGDSEDDVEATLKALKDAKIVLLPVVPESVYSDPYWAGALTGTGSYYVDIEKFKKLPFQLKGPESAFLEFPFGWPFTRIDPTYTVPSGFAPYALDRLATYTGGRSFLYSGEKTPFGFCRRYGCPLCGGQHQACGAPLDEIKLKMTAPDIGSRAEYAARHGRDRLYAAVLNAWDRLHRDGILRGLPPLKAGSGGLSENKPAGPPSYRDPRQDTLKNAETVEKIAAELLEASRKLEKESTLRTVATADAFAVHLLLLGQSYRQFSAYFDELSKPGKPQGVDGVGGSALEPANGEKIISYHFIQYYLCHGGARLKEVSFLGDPTSLHAAFDVADRIIEKHKGTPWEMLIRRASLAVFTPIFERPATTGGSGTSNRTRPSSTSTPNNTETPGSPARPTRPTTADPATGSGTSTGNR
jgi:hypothetical protein